MTLIETLKGRQGLMDAKEVAPLLDMNKEVLYRKAKAGLVPDFRILGQIKFDPVVLAEWLEERQVRPYQCIDAWFINVQFEAETTIRFEPQREKA